jgi:ABC-type multidrug transport system fused ATPase/permease subunit
MIRRYFGEIRTSNIAKAARLLPRKDRTKIAAVVLLQVFFGVLDLVGIALVGILGALAIRGIEGEQAGDRVGLFLNFLNIENETLQFQVTIIGVMAALFLISKTVLSIFFSRKVIYFLSRRGAVISSDLIRKLLGQNLIQVQSRSNQQSLFGVTAGVEAATVGILGATVNLISDVTLLLILSVGLFAVDKVVAISTAVIFGLVALLLYKIMHARAAEIGLLRSTLTVESNEKILEVISAYRESVVKNRRGFYAKQVGKQRMELADLNAEFAFMPQISKYVIEICISVGSLFICATQFMLHDASRAVGILSVFLAASTRIAPAVLRLQQGAIQIKGSQGSAAATFELIDSFKIGDDLTLESRELEINHSGFEPTLKLSGIGFKYSPDLPNVITGIELDIPSGAILAIAGPSGSGKTTLVDVILGILVPTSGDVTISNLKPSQAIEKWPGAIAYVPQDVLIVNGTIRENVSLGYETKLEDEELVWDALRVASLDKLVESLPDGLDTQVGDRGTRFSGGQRQRLGIARAMFSKPKLLILDEATSSLDGDSEAEITDTILNLKGNVTVLIIAHRLSSIRNADQLIYLEAGKIEGVGTFEEVRSRIPNFERQAQLMGL